MELDGYADVDRVNTGVDVGDEMLIGPVVHRDIYVDQDGYDSVLERFDPCREDSLEELGFEIHEYFTNGRPESDTDVYGDDDRFPKTEAGNPYLSDIFEQRTGKCSEVAITTQICIEEVYDEFCTNVIHGQVGDADGGELARHAFLVLENEEDTGEDYIMDPGTRLVDQSEIIKSPIKETFEHQGYNWIRPKENWIENYSRVYGIPRSLKNPLTGPELDQRLTKNDELP